MDMTALLLSRLQFAFTISFHIVFPSFTTRPRTLRRYRDDDTDDGWEGGAFPSTE